MAQWLQPPLLLQLLQLLWALRTGEHVKQCLHMLQHLSWPLLWMLTTGKCMKGCWQLLNKVQLQGRARTQPHLPVGGVGAACCAAASWPAAALPSACAHHANSAALVLAAHACVLCNIVRASVHMCGTASTDMSQMVLCLNTGVMACQTSCGFADQMTQADIGQTSFTVRGRVTVPSKVEMIRYTVMLPLLPLSVLTHSGQCCRMDERTAIGCCRAQGRVAFDEFLLISVKGHLFLE